MPMGTTDQPNRNERQGPAPYTPVQTMQTPRPPGSDAHGRDPTRDKEYPGQYQQGEMIPPPGWAGTTNVDEPYLPRDFDKVLVMRCYPEAESFGELREIAYQHGREVLQMARESTRQMAEIAGQPDPHDLSQWGEPPPLHMRPGQPSPGAPMLANPPPQPPPGQQPQEPQPGQQPGQPPGQQPPNPTPTPPPSREAREGQRQEQQRHEHDEQARRQHERDDDKKK